MSDNTAIEWADSSWPVVTGCTHISAGCDHCYAAKLTSGRLKHLPEYAGLAEHGRFNGTVRCLPDRLTWPYKWCRPRRIFVSDMADLFHESVPDGFIAQVWDVMGQCPQHEFLILTKRHARMRSWVTRWADRTDDRASDKPSGMPPLARGPEAVRAAYTSGRALLFADMLDSMGTPPEGCAYPLYDWMEGWRFWPEVLPNVWLGVSVEDQHWADIRIPALLETPAAVRFISAEPLLGSVDLTWCGGIDALRRDWIGGPGGGMGAPHPLLNWVIAGGESGAGARPCDLEWIRSLVYQCQQDEVPVFVKQLGRVLGLEHGAGPKGGDWTAWPEDLRVRQFPRVGEAVAV